MYVYSGNCRLCETGQPIGISDCAGKPLFTGDIVLTYTEKSELGVSYVAGLTVVVSDQWQSYSDGTHVKNTSPQEFYVMGIKDVPLFQPGEWKVKRVKSFDDVIDGEHWRNFGFNYKDQ